MVRKIYFFIFVILAFAIISVNLISASCTVTLDKTSYVAGETATAAMSCSTNPEKNTDYTLEWTYQNGTSVENDTGTTPNVVNQLFYQSYNIPSTWPEGIFLNASLTGDGLTIDQNDSANVTVFGGGGSNTLEIVNTTFGGGYLGLVNSIKATITDENGKKISGGLCGISVLSNDETRILIEDYSTMIKGMIGLSAIFSHERFSENEDYAYEIECYCGSTGSSTECVDEDGNLVNNSVGSAKNFFTTLNWLTSNTITSINNNILVGDDFSICANVTNVLSNDRIDLEIFYNWRCGSGSNSNTDRIVFGDYTESRGISANTTQMQCHDFIVPNEEHIEKGANQCYGATDVSVISENGQKLLTYSSTSSQFNVTISSIHPNIEFQRASKNIYFSNVSFNDFDVGVKNIHAIVDGDLNGGDTSLTSIINYSVKYMNGSDIPYSTRIFFHEHAIRFQENLIWDDAIEIEIADVNTSLDETFNLTIEFENYEERQTIALEGIDNKTGTFHLAVNCPSYAAPGSDITCQISAQVEDSQIVQKEVDFTCYLYDGISNYNSLNFNQMINHTLFTTNKTISVPSAFTGTQNYIFQCEAGYYNLGSRIDYFYDSFVTYQGSEGSDSSGGSYPSITGDATAELPDGLEDTNGDGIIDERDIPSAEKFSNSAFSKILKVLSLIAFLVLIFVIVVGLKSRSESKKKFAKIFLIALIIVAVVGLIYYTSQFLQGVKINFNLFQDSLFRGIVLTIFISLVIAFLFRALNIRGEIKFGRNKIFDRYHKTLREQHKINKEILKHELEHEKKFKNFKVVRVKK